MTETSYSTCGAVGVLTVGGRAVAELRCTLHFGHGDLGARPMPHRSEIEWTDEAIVEIPDADLSDPEEELVDVPIVESGICLVWPCVRRAGHDGPHDDIVPD